VPFLVPRERILIRRALASPDALARLDRLPRARFVRGSAAMATVLHFHRALGRIRVVFVLAAVAWPMGAPASAPETLLESDPSWHLQSSSDGVSLYRGSIRGSGVVPVKAVLTIPGTIEEVSLVLEDLPRRKEWIGDRTESVLLERPSDYDQTEYLRVHLPWPVSDRSALLRATVSVSEGGRRATIAAQSIESCREDTLPKFVRAQIHPSIFQMVQEPGHVDVLALVFVDPCGSIPKWIVNYFAGRVARTTFIGLRKQVGRNLYSAAQRRAMRERILRYVQEEPPSAR
jgi:START domain